MRFYIFKYSKKAMDLKTKCLNKLKTEQVLARFYTDHYDESYYGFVIDFNDVYLVIEKFDDECRYDGLTVFLRRDITRIKWSGNGIESASKLIDISKRQTSKINIDLTSIPTVLQSVNRLYNHLTVYTQDIDNGFCYVGQIYEVDDNSVVIHEFGTKETLDRCFVLLSIEDITRIDAGGQYENNLRVLFNQ